MDTESAAFLLHPCSQLLFVEYSAVIRCRFAITTGVVGDYESPKVRIQTTFIFKVTATLF